MSKSNTRISRRHIIQGGAVVAGASLVARIFGSETAFAQRAGGAAAKPAAAAAAGGADKLVDEATDATAKGLNYHHDKSKVPKNLQTKRGDSEFKDQSCKTCAFFKDPKNGVGACQLITTGKVKEGGWCMSWAKKQG